MRRVHSFDLPLFALPALLAFVLPLESAVENGARSLGNEPPVCVVEFASGGGVGSADIPITPPFTSVDLTACNSFDPEGGPLTFLWQACPGASFSDPTNCNTTLSVPTPAGSDFQCDVRCIVTDNAGNSSAGNCRLLLHFFENTPPTCVVTPNELHVLATGNSVTVSLDACASFDPDLFQVLTFDWDGCPNASFSDEFACATDMTVDLTGVSLPTTCFARVKVGDGVTTAPFVCRVKIFIDAAPDLDFFPRLCPNPVDVQNPQGTERAVLIGSTGFDVNLVVKASLRMQRVDGLGLPFRPGPFLVTDLGTPDLDTSCACQLATTDGVDDLLMGVDIVEMVDKLLLWNEAPGTSVPVEVLGKLVNGTAFAVSDCVLVQ